MLLALALYYCFSWFCYRMHSKLGLLQALQKRWRPFCLLVGLFVPALNACYWISALTSIYDEVYTALMLILVAMGTEVFVSAFQEIERYTTLPKLWWSVFFGVFRGLLYFVLVYVAYNHFLQQEITEGGLLVALCYTSAVYMVLHFVHGFIFEEMVFKTELVQAIIKRLRIPGQIFVIILTGLYLWTWIPDAFPKILKLRFYLNIALAIDLCVIVNETLFVVAFEYYLTKVKEFKVSKLIKDLTRFVTYAILIMTVMSTAFHINLSSLLVGSTVISVVIGLALQETMGNFVAGMLLDFAKPYKAGDFIEVDGLSGTVVNLNWRSTILRMATGELNIVPNAMVAKSTVKNFSVPSGRQARNITVGVSYEHSPDLVRRVINDALASVPDVITEPAPMIWLSDFADSSMNYCIRYWISDFSAGLTIDSKVREALWYHFSREGINIPYPTSTLLYGDSTAPDRLGEVVEYLGKLDFLQKRSGEFIKALSGIAKLKLYGTGEQVYPAAGAVEKDSTLIVMSGRLKMVLRPKEDEENKTATQNAAKSVDLRPGDIFGDEVRGADAASASVIALEESELICFKGSRIHHLRKKYPDDFAAIKEYMQGKSGSKSESK